MKNDKLTHIDSNTAEYWFIRMQQPVDEVTEAEFLQWLQSADNAKHYEQCFEIWALTGSLVDAPQIQQAINTHAEKQVDNKLPADILQTSKMPKRWLYVTLAAACVALFAIFLPVQQEKFIYYHTAQGKQQEVILEDGSTALLNTNSEIGVSYQTKKRHILLLKGEVTFSVAKNKVRPFVVSAAAHQITAIGTRFNVWQEDRKITVAVLEGKISVSPEHKTGINENLAILTAGQELYYFADGKISEVLSANLHRIDAWAKGRLEFDSVPLGQAIQEYNRYAVKPIVITDAHLQSLPISGVFLTGNISEFISALTTLLPVTTKEERDKILLIPTKE